MTIFYKQQLNMIKKKTTHSIFDKHKWEYYIVFRVLLLSK